MEKKWAISSRSWPGMSSSVLNWLQAGSERGTQSTLSSIPLSSSIRNRASGFTSIMQPGKVGSDTQHMTSSGSPSCPRVSGTNP